MGRAIDLGDALSEAGADPAVDPIRPRNVAAGVEAIRAAFVRSEAGVLSRMLRTWLALVLRADEQSLAGLARASAAV